MGVVMDFQEKQRHKQIDFERRALQDLSIFKIEAAIQSCFSKYMVLIPTAIQTAKDMCAEYAMEAYLLGSSMARFGFYGEDMESAFRRSQTPFESMTGDFCNFWLFWTASDLSSHEGLFETCEKFLHSWWREGYESSLKRWRLKMH
ncbi:DUF2521 family protein [Sporolactobacillus sp. THM7-4]|nr:DUF2521 family protein [Sporolactobacillus sp. THM7-4]